MIPDILETRQRIEAKIEDLISMLDLLDGDFDLEESGDEHDTGMPEGWRPSCGSLWDSAGSIFVLEDHEDGADRENDISDDEPSLGWNLAGEPGQTFDPDCEQDESDRELNGDETDTNFSEDCI